MNDELEYWMEVAGVGSRPMLTNLVRAPDELEQYKQRDRGVEKWLARGVEEGKLRKQSVGRYVAYYLSTGKPGKRGNVEHDFWAGLAASKLYADIKGYTEVVLSREAAGGVNPDWTLLVEMEDLHQYYIEFHSRKNKAANLRNKVAVYDDRLGQNEWLLIIAQSPNVEAELTTDQMFLATLEDLLTAADAWAEAIWKWGRKQGRFSLSRLREGDIEDKRDRIREEASVTVFQPPAVIKCSHPARVVDLSVTKRLSDQSLWLRDDSRSMGIHMVGTRGSGKSRWLGRVLAWQDFLRGVPSVVLDPHGGTITNFLDRVTYLPQEYQESLWHRIVYVDRAGTHGSVVPHPLYYELGNESLFEVARRFLDIIRKSDPYLETASIEGLNAILQMGTYSGMIVHALGMSITEIPHLLRNPKAWSHRFRQAVRNNPETKPAVAFFNQSYNQWPLNVQEKRTNSLLAKISPFELDPVMRATYSATRPGITGEQVEKGRLAVLYDYSGVHDLTQRQFMMLWDFYFWRAYILSRGSGRHIPISIIIDELSAMTNFQSMGLDTFGADLDEFVNQIMRAYMCWLTIAHQELWQFPLGTQRTLMSMGTQIIGATSDHDSAVAMARQLFEYNPQRVRKREPVWMNIAQPDKDGMYYLPALSLPEIVDYTTTEYTPEEQELLNSLRLRNQGRFQWLVRTARAEGDIRGTLRLVTIKNVDKYLYVNEELVAQAREVLSKRCGVPIGVLLTEIDSRLDRKRRRIQRPALGSLIRQGSYKS